MNNPRPIYKNPYELLHIYYLNGVSGLRDRDVDHARFLGMWVEEDTCFLFFSNEVDTYIDELIDPLPGIELVEKYEMTMEQWHGDKIVPYRVEDLMICPPWEQEALQREGMQPIILDPGVVFGTGRHQTTEDCLVLIQRILGREKIDRVLDIGTGTGILSLAASLLGCPHVVAIDFNLLAVRTTLKNVRHNRMEDRILCVQARGEEMASIPSDLLIANIHFDVMKHLVETPGFLTSTWFILSGLLNSEAVKILGQLKTKPVQVIERRCPDGVWNTILGRVTQID
ncbi:MAG: hypothetical protein D3926_23710 [Desulfobacteraceae bacterium]|nr:MAG: hypothetical protein D3926_23710 [Desulfobacteraceae bacterium]